MGLAEEGKEATRLRLFFLCEFDHHDFDWLIPRVHIRMATIRRICRQPISLPGFPDMLFSCAALVHNLKRSAFEGDNDPRMIVTMHGERLLGVNDRLPHLDIFVLELRNSLGLSCVLRGMRPANKNCQENR